MNVVVPIDEVVVVVDSVRVLTDEAVVVVDSVVVTVSVVVEFGSEEVVDSTNIVALLVAGAVSVDESVVGSDAEFSCVVVVMIVDGFMIEELEDADDEVLVNKAEFVSVNVDASTVLESEEDVTRLEMIDDPDVPLAVDSDSVDVVDSVDVRGGLDVVLDVASVALSSAIFSRGTVAACTDELFD